MGKEVSVTTVALCLLEHPHEDFSTLFGYCFLRPAVAACVRQQASLGLLSAVGPTVVAPPKAGKGEGDDEVAAVLETLAGDITGKGDATLRDGDDLFAMGSEEEARVGSVEVQVTADAGKAPKITFVAQHDHYRWRGPQLAHLSFYEYSAMVKVVKKGPVKEDVPGHRRSNARVPFDDRHSCADTMEQQLRSKFVVPILCGPPPPRHPGLPEGSITAQKQAQLDSFASPYLTAFVPWDGETGVPALPLTFQSFEAWFTFNPDALPGNTPQLDLVRQCAWMSSNSFPARCARQVAASMELGLRSSKRTNKLLTDWRFRCATPWDEFKLRGTRDDHRDELTGDADGLFELDDHLTPLKVAAARAVLQHLRDSTRAQGPNPDNAPVASKSHHRDDTMVDSLMRVLAAGQAAACEAGTLHPSGTGVLETSRAAGPDISVRKAQAVYDRLRPVGQEPVEGLDVDEHQSFSGGDDGNAAAGGHGGVHMGDGVPGPAPAGVGPSTALPDNVHDVGRAGPALFGEPGAGAAGPGTLPSPATPEEAQMEGEHLLTAEQFTVCKVVWDWQRARCVEPLKVHLQGPGGSGKTLLLTVMQRYLPPGFVEFTATTGVAAAKIGQGARTHHSSLKFVPPRQGKGRKDVFSAPLNNRSTAALSMNFPPEVGLLIIDEMSM
jgi:hypothetical protein